MSPVNLKKKFENFLRLHYWVKRDCLTRRIRLWWHVCLVLSLNMGANIRFTFSHTCEYLLRNIRFQANIRKTSSKFYIQANIHLQIFAYKRTLACKYSHTSEYLLRKASYTEIIHETTCEHRFLTGLEQWLQSCAIAAQNTIFKYIVKWQVSEGVSGFNPTVRTLHTIANVFKIHSCFKLQKKVSAFSDKKGHPFWGCLRYKKLLPRISIAPQPMYP